MEGGKSTFAIENRQPQTRATKTLRPDRPPHLDNTMKTCTKLQGSILCTLAHIDLRQACDRFGGSGGGQGQEGGLTVSQDGFYLEPDLTDLTDLTDQTDLSILCTTPRMGLRVKACSEWRPLQRSLTWNLRVVRMCGG